MAENDTSSTGKAESKKKKNSFHSTKVGVSDEKSTAYGGQSRHAMNPKTKVAFPESTQKDESNGEHDGNKKSDDMGQTQDRIKGNKVGVCEKKSAACVSHSRDATDMKIEDAIQGSTQKDIEHNLLCEKKSTTYGDHSSDRTESRIETIFQVSVQEDESDCKQDGNKTSDGMPQTQDGRNGNKGEKKSTTYRDHLSNPTDLDTVDTFQESTKIEKFDDRHDGNKTSDDKRQMQDGTTGNKAPQFLLQALYNEENLYKNEKGKYEWQWRKENGWDEKRKCESTDLDDVFRTRKNEKGFMIKTKDGYRWISAKKGINEEDIKIDIHDRAEDRKELPMGKKTKIIFIGPVGSGKSATINTLLGENSAPYETNLQENPVTKDIKEYNSDYGILVDTPGLTEEYLPSILSYLPTNPPDVIAIVFAASRIKSSEMDAIKNINTDFGAYFDKAFLLITKADDLQENVHDFLGQDKSKELFSLYCRVGRRYVVFENTASLDQKLKYNCKFKDSIHRILNPNVDSLLQRFLRNVRNFFSFRR